MYTESRLQRATVFKKLVMWLYPDFLNINVNQRKTFACYSRVLIVGKTECTLSSALNQQIDAKKTARCRRVLIVTKLFNIAISDLDEKESARCRRVRVIRARLHQVSESICINAAMTLVTQYNGVT